jgi:hypothetical protein
VRRAAAFVVDLLVLVALGTAVFIVITGGGVYVLAGTRLSLRRIDNVLIAAGVFAAIRCWMWGCGPRVTAHMRRVFDRFESNAWDIRRLSRAVAVIAIGTLAAKLWLAWAHPGFFSGDDVEIHEMTLGHLLGQRWSVWELRNAFFPMVFVYPAQWLAHAAGVTGMPELVFAGRAVVAVLSTASIWLVWRIGLRVFARAPAYAVIATALFAVSKLHVSFGSSELPRPVATVFVLGAFAILQRAGGSRALLAGVLIGVAGALRFSEIMFVGPAVAWLGLERRWRDGICVGLAAVAAFGIVIGAADALYTGSPFSSLRFAFDYTIAKGQSSRGYNSAFWYATHGGIWSTWIVVALALAGTRRRTVAVACWAWLPVLALSALPHKEARYLIPVVPFVSLLAAEGCRRLIAYARQLSEPKADFLRATLIVCVVLSALHDMAGWRLARTDADLRAMAAVRAADPRPDAVIAVEQEWRVGGRLYLDGRSLVILNERTLVDLPSLLRTHAGVSLFVIDEKTVERLGYAGGFAARGYRELPRTPGSSYRVFGR